MLTTVFTASEFWLCGLSGLLALRPCVGSAALRWLCGLGRAWRRPARWVPPTFQGLSGGCPLTRGRVLEVYHSACPDMRRVGSHFPPPRPKNLLVRIQFTSNDATCDMCMALRPWCWRCGLRDLWHCGLRVFLALRPCVVGPTHFEDSGAIAWTAQGVLRRVPQIPFGINRLHGELVVALRP